VELDHVVIAVADLEAAAEEIETRYGLASIEGGRHPGWGTANRIIPLGETYLELVAVVDAAEAAGSDFGRRVASGVSDVARPLGWVVRTDELEKTARRLGLSVGAGSRALADGRTLRWRYAGIEEPTADPSLPFFIQWAPETALPGRAEVTHRAGRARISKLVLKGDPDRVAAWLGGHALPIVVHRGLPAVAAVVISTAAEEIVLGEDRRT
jgi:Glyoxalase-like domain